MLSFWDCFKKFRNIFKNSIKKFLKMWKKKFKKSPEKINNNKTNFSSIYSPFRCGKWNIKKNSLTPKQQGKKLFPVSHAQTFPQNFHYGKFFQFLTLSTNLLSFMKKRKRIEKNSLIRKVGTNEFTCKCCSCLAHFLPKVALRYNKKKIVKINK